MKLENKLARAFVEAAELDRQIESTAAKILAIIRDSRVKTLAAFDKLVKAAYAANGWNARPGRPASGEAKKNPVPGTVRTYVTTIRRAMRAKLKVGKFRTFTSLRGALEKRGGSPRRPVLREAKLLALPAPVRENFAGVSVTTPAATTGALFHDLAVVYAKLPAEPQALLTRQLNQILTRYLPMVPGKELKKAA